VVSGMTLDADVVVVGAGPVGSALGLMLRHEGMRTVVLDRAHFPRDKPCGEGLLPNGARILRELDIHLERFGFPLLEGVRYRLPGEGWVRAAFGAPAFGVRRTRLDELLAGRAQAITGVHVERICRQPGSVLVETSLGVLQARAVVAADGLRSAIRRQLGWEAPSGKPGRYGLVGHLEVPSHGWREITVTVLDAVETYVAPTGRDQLLLAVLGPQGRLRQAGSSVKASYLALAGQAHPQLAGARLEGPVHGAGPFGIAARPVAGDRVFLCGDAAGFLDPLTGEAISAGLAQAAALSRMLAKGLDGADRLYRRWHQAQWRQRQLLSHLALRLVSSRQLARRAIRGIARRPLALERLIAVSDGSRLLSTLHLLDWAALAGW
jgi:flavin-dependent dehydrogenase